MAYLWGKKSHKIFFKGGPLGHSRGNLGFLDSPEDSKGLQVTPDHSRPLLHNNLNLELIYIYIFSSEEIKNFAALADENGEVTKEEFFEYANNSEFFHNWHL